LQIAHNYWELLTLEEDEPVAREELLAKAEEHALQAILLAPKNVNAHFILGQISLKQNNNDKAITALERSVALGIPKDKALPYIAEALFKLRNFKRLRRTLDDISPAFRSYPPLSNVIEFWA